MNSRRADQRGAYVDEGAVRHRRGRDGGASAGAGAGAGQRPPLARAGARVTTPGAPGTAAGAGRTSGAPAAGGTEQRARVLLAHNAATATCDALARIIEATGAELVDASSMDDARLALEMEAFDACLICLDLPPAPLAGARLATELLERGAPVVLVTRSLRWLPAGATALQSLPWISPDATAEELARAMAAVAADCDSGIRMRAGLGLEAAAESTPSSRLLRG